MRGLILFASHLAPLYGYFAPLYGYFAPLYGYFAPLYGYFAPAAIGWDIGAALDNAMYQFVLMLATVLWAPHAILFSLARYLQAIAFYLATGILPVAMSVVQSVIASTGLAATLTTIALMLVGIGYLVSPYLPEFRVASLGRIAIFSVAMIIFLSQGPAVVEQLELARLGLADGIADSAFQQLTNDPGFNAASDSLADSPESGLTNLVIKNEYDDRDGTSAYDVAASSIPVCPRPIETGDDNFEYLCAEGAELSVSLPFAFRNIYFRHDSLTDSMSGSERTEAKEKAWRGVSRLLMTQPITLVALLDAVATVLFSAAAGFILLTLPLALLFAVFLPLENMATSLLKMYLNLFLYTGVVSVLTSIGVAAQLAAIETQAIAPLVGASAIALMMEFIAIKAGLTALSQAVSSFANSMSANLGMSGGGGPNMVGTAAQVALGAATGGTSLAVGLAAAGAGAGLMQAGSKQEGTTRGGALSMVGGALIGRSPLRGAGLALGMMAMGRSPVQTGRGEDGGDTGFGQALADSSAVEAGMAGMSASSGSPMGMFLAMNRMRQQRAASGERAPVPPAEQPESGYYAPPRADGTRPRADGAISPPVTGWSDSTPPPAPAGSAGQPAPTPQPAQAPPYRPAPNSPWRPVIAATSARHGDGWVNEVAERARQVRAGYQQRGESPVQAAANFAGPQGQPSLNSPGAREVLRGLPGYITGTLNTEQGQEGAQAIIADVVTPRITQDRQAIAKAVAVAVAPPAQSRVDGALSRVEAQRDPARDVAVALSARPEELGGYYGSVGRFVGLAQQQGLDGAAARQVVASAAGGQRVGRDVVDTLRQAGVSNVEARNLIRAAQLLPDKLEIAVTSQAASTPTTAQGSP